MNQSDLTPYDMIFRRQSIREYAPAPLTDQQLDGILWDGRSLTAQYAVDGSFSLLSKLGGFNLFSVKAPHYLAWYAPEHPQDCEMAGFICQMLSLHLSLDRIGTCFLGSARPAKTDLDHEGGPFIIMLAVGTPRGEAHREQDAFKRKPIGEIARLSHPAFPEEMRAMLEAARLAPSSTNRQGWYFICDRNRIHLYTARTDKLSRIDIGIALCHMQLAAEAHALRLLYRSFDGPAHSGHTPVMTLVINE